MLYSVLVYQTTCGLSEVLYHPNVALSRNLLDHDVLTIRRLDGPPEMRVTVAFEQHPVFAGRIDLYHLVCPICGLSNHVDALAV